ncbi:hypothetical protein BURK1_00950 [Burkholderiales bacterium]|nr:hypothetical protein BURK1_00950 [Burkholderiales bacterium]
MKPRVLVVTRIPFWRQGAGERMRLVVLLGVLGARTELTVLYLGPVGAEDLQRLRQLRIPCALRTLSRAGDPSQELAAVRHVCAEQSFDACILERIALHFLLDAVPAGVRTVLDTHDLESANAESRRAQGQEVPGAMDFAEELAILSRFDGVLLIQAEDHERIARHLGARALLAPHPVRFERRPVEPRMHRLGLVASAWAANRDGLDWFADHVWPRVSSSPAEMHLYGWIGDHWRPGYAQFQRHGFVPDFGEAWGRMDVAINPVRWGSGLKVKSVEALGHGLPLVTTSEGARGMLAAAGDAFILADDPAEFAAACVALLADPQRRAALGAAAYAYAQRHFSPETCFGQLVTWLCA